MRHENWHNEKYMSEKRGEVVRLAFCLRETNCDFVETIRQINSLKNIVCENEHDHDFIFFAAIDSETDHIPDNTRRSLFSQDWLDKCDNEIQKLRILYQDDLFQACGKLIERFSR